MKPVAIRATIKSMVDSPQHDSRDFLVSNGMGFRLHLFSHQQLQPSRGIHEAQSVNVANWSSATTPAVPENGYSEKAGNYYCWNRTFDPSTGRWTTPDAAATPWGNLLDYSKSNPVYSTDPSGNTIEVVGDDDYKRNVLQAIWQLCPHTSADILVDHGTIMYPPDLCSGYWIMYHGCGPDGGKQIQYVGGYSAEGHEVGCNLVRCLLCSEKKFVIEEDGAHVTPDKRAAAKAKSVVEDGDKEGDVIEPNELGGTGATIGMPRIPVRHWISRKPDGTKCHFKPSFPRLIAHEFGHACAMSRGEQRPTGTGSCSAPGFNNMDEWHTIKNWENPIAKELANAGYAGETGRERIDSGAVTPKGDPAFGTGKRIDPC